MSIAEHISASADPFALARVSHLDPVLVLKIEHDRVKELAMKARDRADLAFFRDKEQLSPHIAERYYGKEDLKIAELPYAFGDRGAARVMSLRRERSSGKIGARLTTAPIGQVAVDAADRPISTRPLCLAGVTRPTLPGVPGLCNTRKGKGPAHVLRSCCELPAPGPFPGLASQAEPR